MEPRMQIHENDLVDLIVKSTTKVAEDSGGEAFQVDRKTELFGGSSPLDSLMLVSLVFDLENAIEEAYGTRVALATERALTEKVNPFTTVDTLAKFACRLLAEA